MYHTSYCPNVRAFCQLTKYLHERRVSIDYSSSCLVALDAARATFS